MLGNVSDFEPETEMVARSEMPELDRWMLSRFSRYLSRLEKAYENYNFHYVFHHTIELMTVELSSFYADIIKDRLYCDAPKGISRKSAQTALYIMVRDMARILSPVLSFTAEEVWQHLPGKKAASVFLAGFPRIEADWYDEALMDRWSALREVRRLVTKVLEDLRKAGTIGNALQANVTVSANGETLRLLQSFGEESLSDLFLVSKVTLKEGDAAPFAVKSEEPKCPRCWRQGHGIGENAAFRELCLRCASVMSELIENGEVSLDD
jgi:isoleucyl-tRNA synthetase